MLRCSSSHKLAGAVLALSLAASAQAADGAGRPMLRAEASVLGEIVRIGDLVENAGPAAEVAIFRAPDLGQTGAVPVARLVEALRTHRLSDLDTRGLRDVAVSRASRTISRKEIEERITAAFAGQNGFGTAQDLTLTFDREPRPIEIEPTAEELRVLRAVYDPSARRFDVSLELPGTPRRMNLRFTGTLVETAEVATLSRALARGDVIRASDVAIERKPKSLVGDTTLRSAEQVVGLAARRSLQPGQPLRAPDVMKPEVVRANETVTIVYEVPGMALTARGKALDAGAEGDLVNVLNPQSKRTLQATVIGPGRVSVAPAAPAVLPETQAALPTSLAAALPPQRAE